MDWRNDDIVQRLGLDMVTYILILTSVSLNFAFGELAGKRKETIDLFTLLSKLGSAAELVSTSITRMGTLSIVVNSNCL